MKTKHRVEWLTAAPLWSLALDDDGVAPARFKQPALLRFAGDGFMDELQSLLASRPADLSDLVVRQESWDREAAGWVTEGQLGDEVVKLFQPAHNRFYLVAAELVCRRAGLPERKLDPALDRTSFVVRRLVPKVAGTPIDPGQPDGHDEMAWLGDRQGGRWSRLADPEGVSAGEERLPLFPLTFRQEDQPRRLMTGLIGVGAREAYETGARESTERPSNAEIADDPLADSRVAEFDGRVIASLDGLVAFPDPLPADPPETEDDFDNQALASLTFTLLDLTDFLERELPSVWSAVEEADGAALSGAALDVFDQLGRTILVGGATFRQILQDLREDPLYSDLLEETPSAGVLSQALGVSDRSEVRTAASRLLDGSGLRDAIVVALDDPRKAELRERVLPGLEALATLDDEVEDDEARSELLLWLLDAAELLDRELNSLWQAVVTADSSGLNGSEQALIDLLSDHQIGTKSWAALLRSAAENASGVLTGETLAAIEVLEQALSRGQIAAAAGGLVDSGFAASVDAAFDADPLTPPVTAADSPAADAIYVIRCVYERPRCGNLDEPVCSLPSQPFRLASFFDSEGPTRPVAIRMPDADLASLRRFPKGVSMQISKKLRQQMERAQRIGMKGLVEGEAGQEPAFDLGVICSFSIPIITICALILLMIIASILNIVFWWLPLLRICLPAPRSSS